MLFFEVTLRASLQNCARETVSWPAYPVTTWGVLRIVEGRVCSSAAHGIGRLETSRVQTSCTPYQYLVAGHHLAAIVNFASAFHSFGRCRSPDFPLSCYHHDLVLGVHVGPQGEGVISIEESLE